ncbi:MAG: WYL domain-containing protein [Acidimicrobiales bacterium]
MRADRLVATLLILQARKWATAAEIAEELEVSVKTTRRDLDALAMAGIPVYSQAGRGGGWTLLGGARTDLTGLRSDESQALFLAAGSAPRTSRGLKDALRKLVQAVPEPFRADAAAAVQAVVVDPARWNGPTFDSPVFLEQLQQAVISREQIDLEYESPRTGISRRRVHPLGLVVKASIWYLVAQTADGQRTFRVDRVANASPTGEPAVRPAGFDLGRAWSEITTAYDEQARTIVAEALAEPWTLPILHRVVGTQLELGDEQPDRRTAVRISAYSVQALAGQVAGLAAGLEVLSPPEVKDALAVIGDCLTNKYR